MITSAKNYTKTNEQTNKNNNNNKNQYKTKKRTDRTLGQMVKVKLYRQNHTQEHTHTHSVIEKKENVYIYRCSQSPLPQFGMIHCLFRYSTDAGTSRCLWRFNPLLLRLLGEISLSLLCSHSSWCSALDLASPLHVGRLRASVPAQTGWG